ncbi:MAG: GNAT family N-acetyltransferase [Dokdonella sp.]
MIANTSSIARASGAESEAAKISPQAEKEISTSAGNQQWTDVLRDGTHVIVRAIHPEDGELERAFIQKLSPESRHFRFLGSINQVSDDLLHKLTDVDFRRDFAFIALVHRDGEKQEIGVSRFSMSVDGTSCECAVAVADDWQKKGLGTLLMRHLITVARERGVHTMISMDAADNTAMQDLASFLGFHRKADPDDSTQVIHTLEL